MPDNRESDRFLMVNTVRALAAEAGALGVSVVRAVTVDTAEEVRAAAHRLGLPVTVEPSDLADGRGAALVSDEAGLDAWRRRIDETGPPGPYLVEEYAVGPEFSVETLTVDGAHYVIGITAKQSGGHVLPAPLPEREQMLIRSSVTALLDLADYESGPAHTDVVLTARGPRIVASQAGPAATGSRC
ncbi:hypothetical protein [Kitasatospora sp. GP82]|uniref:ATP-grasp domain-containing protein n=1 Tax=Kitasatospora sp. GP82 TaxID=3035089 RepID=UPI0024764F1B|nr:hypothetical protein [Kitasatospora sp. GP82]MDH6129694.1 biotin carboxylase [Kitasatospora sp. GP82]